jgi:hypothetical protein
VSGNLFAREISSAKALASSPCSNCDEIQKVAGLIAAANIIIVRCLGHVEFVIALCLKL